MKLLNIPLDHGWSFKERRSPYYSSDSSSSSPSDPASEPASAMTPGLLDDELQCPENPTVVDRKGLQEQWTTTMDVPSEIHVELLKHGVIPDPYVGFNEHRIQWIGEVEWLYKIKFDIPESAGDRNDNVMLTFEGLDTFCDIYLNGTKLLTTENSYKRYFLNLQSSLHTAKSNNNNNNGNILLLHFKSAKKIAKAEELRYGKVRAGSTNLGDPSRVYVRKSQYDWRWDWGPELMTCGPFRPITLTLYTSRIQDFYPKAFYNHTTQTSSLKLDITLELESQPPESGSGPYILEVTLLAVKDGGGSGGTGDVVHTSIIPISSSTSSSGDDRGEMKNILEWDNLVGVQPWWPVGYGDPNLYTLQVTLKDEKNNNNILHVVSKTIGFRSIKLIQEPLLESDQCGAGTSFCFEVNGVRMFMAGSNWVPGDSFLTTITDERYRAWLTLLKQGNQNMIRIWGGGIYEPDIFHDICDELGILVWLDFPFACGVYPAHPEFVENVRQEAQDNLLRLRHHPSLSLLCGNNEDYQMILQWGDHTDLPARKLYEDVFPNLVSRLIEPEVPYWRGSPYGGKGWDTSDPTVGDVHQWNIWGGKELPYQKYDEMGGRFVSEFGIPALPSTSTIKHWMQNAPKEEWYSQSAWMSQHNRAGANERRFAVIMNENFRITDDFEKYHYLNRMMQADAVGYAYKVWRRNWKGKGKEFTSGVIVWQLNDCWPVTSWAIADYFLRPKPVYHAIKKEMSPISVGILRTVHKNRDNDRPKQFYEFGAFQSTSATLDIWAGNSTLSPRKNIILELQFFDLYNPSWSLPPHTQTFTLLQNQSTELVVKYPCPAPAMEIGGFKGFCERSDRSFGVVCCAVVRSEEGGEVLARAVDFPMPYRYIDWPDPKLSMDIRRGGTGTLGLGLDSVEVVLRVERPLMGLWLVPEDEKEEGVEWSENCIDLVPGEKNAVSVWVKGLGSRGIKAAWMGREKVGDV